MFRSVFFSVSLDGFESLKMSYVSIFIEQTEVQIQRLVKTSPETFTTSFPGRVTSYCTSMDIVSDSPVYFLFTRDNTLCLF